MLLGVLSSPNFIGYHFRDIVFLDAATTRLVGTWNLEIVCSKIDGN